MGLLARSKGAPAVILSNLTGDNVAIAPPLPALLGQNFGFRDWFKGAQQTGKPYVSSAYRSVATGAPARRRRQHAGLPWQHRASYATSSASCNEVPMVAEGARQVPDRASSP